PQDVMEVWDSWDGSAWVAEPSLIASCSAICDTIWLSGVSWNGPHAYLLGAYSISNNDSNGAPIYKKQDGANSSEITIRMSDGNKWSIKTENETLTTEFTTAITNPVEINNTWTVSSGTIVLDCYFGQEGICSEVLLDGSSIQRKRQGIFSLYGPLLNGRPVYIHERGDTFLDYIIMDKQRRFWLVSDNINSSSGGIRVYDSALSADGITRTWETYDSQDGWVKETKMGAACITNNTVPSETLYMGGVVTSSTPQTQRLGFYTKHRDYHNSRPVYIHESGKYALYYLLSRGYWGIVKATGTASLYMAIYSASLLPQEITVPLYGWVSGWTLMDNITMSSYTNTGDESCRKLNLSGMKRDSLNGLYENNDQDVGKRPSYKHSDGPYNLYFRQSHAQWVIGQDPIQSSFYAYTFNPAVDPTDISTNIWRRWDGSDWIDQPDVVWSCQDDVIVN
ncbi:unnamed protein product, partial [Owenia fusiformis]